MKPEIATKNIRNTVREMIKTKFLTDEDIASKPRE
jgi:glycerate kinase